MEDNSQNQKATLDSVRRKANFYFFSKVWFNFLLIVIGTILLGVFLSDIYSHSSLAKQEKNSRLALGAAAQIIERSRNNAEILTKVFHEGNQKTLDDLDILFSKGLLQTIMDNDDNVRIEILHALSSRIGLDYLFLMNMDGKVVLCEDRTLLNTNPSVEGYLTQENVNQVLRFTGSKNGTVTPVLVKSRFGTFYFYSRSCLHKNTQYALVIGTKASTLDNQINTLNDSSQILSSISVINNGFLFAVNKKDNLFLYFKNGKTLLTGQNAINCGLSENALTDGYSGTETILGETYYCFSRALGDSSVICAAVPTSFVKLTSNRVLFWPLMSFVIIMIVCLSFAVMVRNDFVRRAVKTKRLVLFKDSLNPSYFDKSIFAKVFPLVFAGVLAVFAISLYSQTLIELGVGINESKVALQEVTGRYQVSQTNSKVVEGYYNDRFLSTARVLSLIIEEDPSILNAASDYYHSDYDENGNRRFLIDDEGNRLKSISKSSRLQQLCDANEIDSIYVFDQSGHTIATNTPNWFFSISHNKENQSYPFLKVLSGESDSLVQKHMTNDLGEDTQYFGVNFHYYTTKDNAGNTLYVSRSAYEEAVARNGGISVDTGNVITKHNSLLQIELDEDIAGKLLAPTTIDYILSTNMLDGGAIVMFDNTSDHKCVYSPVKASIGQSAEALGFSSNAFTGLDYYGFSNINGINYLLYFRYLNENDHFFATALPKSEVFSARGKIAIHTAWISLVLILILLLTVTLTTKDEETLYENMSEEREKEGLNSAIFNIILPSGRSASTKQAAARWDNKRIKWSDRPPEQKLGIILLVLFSLLLAYVAFSVFGLRYSFSENSFIQYVFSGLWDRRLNIFSITACGLALATIILTVIGFRIPVRIMSTFLGTRGETLGRLLLSIVRYVCVIGGLFYCLYLVGFDSGSLIASAGIMSLVIGLGAQSLIKDILAGIFIVFEGEFRVGDIVTISDFRGTVMDIGLRTTKIMGPTGNIKIYNNSDISGVLNMTKEASVAACTISIEYGQDIEYVEAVLKRDLPHLQEKNPLILDGPTYAGVSNLGSSGVDLLIYCKCFENDIKGVVRFLNKEVLQIFYRNGINVPFPNVTVSQLDTSARKTMEDFVPEPTEESMQEEQKQ